ncbi:MAG TPA: DUF4384 domain-containing protein [Polyangiaceae bacterium]|jgi:DNA polymerase-3 subunit gamma/tau|nr:DUF4384 domain-containing protein [Polyangiaceae bacterium]
MIKVQCSVLWIVAAVAGACASSAPSPAAAPPPPADRTSASVALPAAVVAAPTAAPAPSAPGDTRGVHLANDPPAAASAAAPPPSQQGAAPSPVLTFGMSNRLPDGSVQSLPSGGSLRSGEKFWLDVAVNVPLYVYVVWISPDGKSDVLYPPDGTVLLSAGVPQRVPTVSSDSFQLDNVPGTERLVILATRGDLGHDAADVSAAIARIRASRRWPTDLLPVPTAPSRPPSGPIRAAPSPPAPATGVAPHHEEDEETDAEHATRGVVLNQGLRQAAIRIAPDDSGIIVMPFVIHHLP